MLRRILSEIGFRLGRKSDSPDLLKWASRKDPAWLRPAFELARRGIPGPASHCLLDSFSALRACSIARGGPLFEGDRQFLASVLANLERSTGQIFQDVAALLHSSRETGGFFVEVGVGDGEKHSNSFMLEREFGWTGVLVEPDRRFHARLSSTRTARLEKRPAFSRHGVNMRFLEASGSGELSTLKGFGGEDGRIRRGRLYEVQTVTLDAVLEQSKAPRTIDYVSIDTEGSELEVLAALDLNRWDVRFLTIEHNFVPGKKERITELLAPHGFRPVLQDFSHMDLWLARPGG